MTDTPPNYRTNIQSYFRSPFAPRIHFDEAGVGAAGGAGGAGAGAAGAAAGAGAKPWFDGIDGETIGHWDNKGWKKDDPKALATELTKAWKGLEKHFGAPADQILRLPKDAADEAGWNAVRQRLGAPKDASEYDFSNVKYADGSELEPGFVDTMRAALHKVGAPKDSAPEVVKAVVKFLGDADGAEAAERATKLQAERAALQKDWGTNFEYNKLTAMQGAKRLGVDAETVAKLEAEVGYSKIMEMFRKIGAGTNEDTFVDAGQGGNPTTLNGAKARIAELNSDPDWVSRYLKGSAKEVNEMNSLIALANGIAA